MRRLGFVIAALAGVLSLPAAAYAQAAIAGGVHDSSGAALPGLAVEATSPALMAGP